MLLMYRSRTAVVFTCSMINIPDLISLLLSLFSLVCLTLLQLDVFPGLWKILTAWVTRLILPFLYIFPSLVVILSAVLIFTSLRYLKRTVPSTGTNQTLRYAHLSRAVLRVGLALILLLSLAYVTFWASVWDQTSDGLGGVWLMMQSVFVAVIAGAVMGIKARSWFRSVGFFFALLVPILLIGAFSFGWSVSYHTLTEQRATRIASALDRYHTREGHFPSQLQELVPRDLFWIPSQVILRHEDWCYQGDQSTYRLGAYWRKNFSTPLEIRIYASAGSLPDAGWVCQTHLPELKQKYDPSDFYQYQPD